MDRSSELISLPKEPYKCAIGPQMYESSKNNNSIFQMTVNQNDKTIHSGVHSHTSKRFQLIPYDQSTISVVKEVCKTPSSSDEFLADENMSEQTQLPEYSAKSLSKPLAKVSPLVNNCHQSVQTDALSIDLDSLMHLEDLSRSQRIYGLKSKLESDKLCNQNDYQENNQLKELLNRNDELEALLKTQLKVNSDLKKLLLSSVGEKSTQFCEELSIDCCQLRSDLSEARLELLQLQEKYDQLSIEADMWKSKFIAGRVMVEELASWKSRLTNRYSESVTALQVIAQEMKVMSENVRSMRDSLLECQEVEQSPGIINTIDLTANCRHLLEETLSSRGLVRKSIKPQVSSNCSSSPVEENTPPVQDKTVSVQRGSVATHLVSVLWRQLCSGGVSSVKLSGTTAEDQAVPVELNSPKSEHKNEKKTSVSIVRESNEMSYDNCTLGEKLFQQVLYQHSLLAIDPTYRYHSSYNSPSSQTFERLSDSCKKCKGEITVL